MVNQSLRNRYVVENKLIALLRRLFGSDYQVEEKSDHYLLTIPRQLTQVLGNFTAANSLGFGPSGIGMEKLRELVLEVQNKNRNVQGRGFVSDQDLCEVVTRDAVYEALSNTLDDNYKLGPYHIDEAVDVVVKGARRIFAILVHIRQTNSIRQFIENDKYQATGLDPGLPFDKDKLSAIFSARATVEEFYERQWHFTAPIFTDSIFTRVLPPETILPFVKDESIGGGGFGEVYNIEIASSHQRFNNESWYQRELVRKEFKPRDETRSIYETELRNLSILKLLRHPNIIEVLSSYAYQKKLNLIFPRARGGTLKDLLNRPRPQPLIADEAILVALSGLCSAVCAVHCFVSSSRKLELIGCHHDLKPANVLVEDSRFLLADFGLSKFKEASELSDTPSRTVHPYYAPPECYKSMNSLEKPIVHRSSDIWSLGCIIAEVVTYMLDGAKGVTEFEKRRVLEEDSFIRHRFHRGGAEEPAVTAWIKKLKRSGLRTQQMLGCLVQEMLQIQQKDRPQARQVEAKMRFIAVDAVCQPIHDLYIEVCNKSDSIQPTLERTRFDSWRYACGILELDKDDPLGEWNESTGFSTVLETLGQIQDELKAVLADCRNPRSRIFEPLRQLNDLLIDRLSYEGQNQGRVYLETQMMLEPSDIIALASIGEYDASLSQDRRLSILATVKCITETLQRRPSHSGSIDSRRLEKETTVGDFEVHYLKGDNGEDKRRVLVEWKTYQDHYGDKRTAAELQERLEEITDILKTANHAAERDSFRVLPCAGFYQDPSAYSCGLVYEFPASSSKGQKFITLRSALEETRDKLEQQPSLEQRFQLAQVLATSVLNFHTVSWLQKSISSFNVTFFHSSNESWLNGITNPFFLGFLYSRSNDPNAFTEGPTEDAHHRDYQHPAYRRKKVKNLKYRAEYDYYSLGLVLLEIGLWKSLGEIFKTLHKLLNLPGSRAPPPLDSILLNCVPRLRLTMGTRYQDVVETCLLGRFKIHDGLDERSQQSKLHRSFSRLVVERLAECKL